MKVINPEVILGLLDKDSAWIMTLSLFGLNKENRFDRDMVFSSVSL